MKLVIVESPNKVRKIKDFLGSGYRVAASFGHVRDLPAKGDLAVAFLGGKVTPTYEMLERSERHIRELKTQAEGAEAVLLAMDPDREGEAIAWHVSRLLGERKYLRVVFHSITKAEVQKAMAAPRELDQRLVDAQQARRVLDDELVGVEKEAVELTPVARLRNIEKFEITEALTSQIARDVEDTRRALADTTIG